MSREHSHGSVPRCGLRGHAMAALSPLPPPEEVFSDWLLSLPHGANLEASARTQVELIDRRGSLHPDVLCLRALLVAMAGDVDWRRPLANL